MSRKRYKYKWTAEFIRSAVNGHIAWSWILKTHNGITLVRSANTYKDLWYCKRMFWEFMEQLSFQLEKGIEEEIPEKIGGRFYQYF